MAEGLHLRETHGALETAGVLPAVEVVLSVVNVVSFMTKPLLNRKTARQICRARFTARQETAASQPHTDYSRVDRVENVVLLDAKRP